MQNDSDIINEAKIKEKRGKKSTGKGNANLFGHPYDSEVIRR